MFINEIFAKIIYCKYKIDLGKYKTEFSESILDRLH